MTETLPTMTVSLPQRRLDYDPQVRERWRQGGRDVRAAMRSAVGDLGRKPSTYGQQHNFHEYSTARHVIEDDGYSPAGLVYENWRLRDEVGAGLTRAGTDLVLRAFNSRFFQIYADFVLLNPDARLNAHVDLFAFDDSQTLPRCGFFEVKNDEGDGQMARHQELLLAFISYVSAVFPHAVVRATGLNVRAEVVYCVRAGSVFDPPNTHEVTFIPPREAP